MGDKKKYLLLFHSSYPYYNSAQGTFGAYIDWHGTWQIEADAENIESEIKRVAEEMDRVREREEPSNGRCYLHQIIPL